MPDATFSVCNMITCPPHQMQELEYWKLTQANGKKCTHQAQLAVEQQ
jgi:hypothetical protein